MQESSTRSIGWIGELSKALNGGLLPEGYYALSEQHAREGIEAEYVADVLTLEHRDNEHSDSGSEDTSGGLAVAEAPPKTILHAEAELTAVYALRRRTLAIRPVSGDRLVALVEIASPGNKDRRASVSDFASECVDALGHGLHLVVIDLLPPGAHDLGGLALTVARSAGLGALDAPPGSRVPAVAFESAEFVRAYKAFGVGDALPTLPLFYRAGWYVNLPLGQTYDAAFAGVPRHLRRRLEE